MAHNAYRTEKIKSLQATLGAALPSPSIRSCMLWPLVVLGVAAAEESVALQAFVADQLVLLSRHLGTHVPITAKLMLETFWASGQTRWDACFDRPYVFTTFLSLDIHQMLSADITSSQ